MGFSGSACIKFGWETFKKRPWFLIGAFLLVSAVSGILSNVFEHAGAPGTAAYSLAYFINIVIQVFVGIGMTAFALKAHDSVNTVSLRDLWRPEFFLSYLAMSIVFFIATCIGFLLLIIPGFIVILMYYFAGYLIVDRGLGPIESMKESARITKGHRWQLLGFLGLIILLNVLGVILLIVGLLVTIPVTLLAVVHAYRTLSAQASSATA